MEVETVEYKDFNIKIWSDECPCDPRKEWDNLGTMICEHRRYNLGDEHDLDEEDIRELIKRKDVIILDLFLYDHSGITMNTSGFSCQWDSGQVGIIYIDYAKIRSEYSWKRITKKRREQIIGYLKNEVKTYDDFLTGQVYGYDVEDKDGDQVTSCGGYYGYDHKESGLMEQAEGEIDAEIECRRKARQEKLKALLKNKVSIETKQKELSEMK